MKGNMIGTMLYDSYTATFGMIVDKADGHVNDWVFEWFEGPNCGKRGTMSEMSLQVFIRNYESLKRNIFEFSLSV
jgi:hypothetical protein